MVPDSYHTFFSATAEISGTLIGLLVGAKSVARRTRDSSRSAPPPPPGGES